MDGLEKNVFCGYALFKIVIKIENVNENSQSRFLRGLEFLALANKVVLANLE